VRDIYEAGPGFPVQILKNKLLEKLEENVNENIAAMEKENFKMEDVKIITGDLDYIAVILYRKEG